MTQLATQGIYINTFYNDGDTYTSHAIPALWSGSWAGVVSIIYNGNKTQDTLMPSIFEYYRKQKNAQQTDAIYELKYISSKIFIIQFTSKSKKKHIIFTLIIKNLLFLKVLYQCRKLNTIFSLRQ